MGIGAKILAFFNIVAALVLFYQAGRVFTVRQRWMAYLEAGEQVRDGVATDQILEQARSVIARLSPEQQQRLQEKIALLEIAESEYARRKLAADILLDPIQQQPGAINSDENKRKRGEIGAKEVREVIHEYFKYHFPRLQAEEQRLAAEKDSLLQIRHRRQQRIAYLEQKIKEQEEYFKAEKALTAKVLAENQERRRELARLYAELEEAVAAREISLGRERDMKQRLADAQRRVEQLTAENQQLVEQIRRAETAQAGRSE